MEDSISSRPTATSAEVVGRNEDLLTEILIRVPAKPLLKFKCVSKQWLSLISDPKFCHSHTLHLFTHNPTPSALLLNNEYDSTPEFDIVPLKDDNPKVPYLDYLNVPRIKILQSCNGLLLCSSTYLTNPSDQSWKEFVSEMYFRFRCDYSNLVVTDDDKGKRYFICNPTTKQFKTIACPCPKFQEAISSLPFYLAFDPLKSPHYKVLLLRHVGDGKYDIDIYSSETGSWSFGRHSFQGLPHIITNDVCAFYNGAIHWWSVGNNSVYFEVDSESLKTFPMPLTVDTSAVKYFGESQGHLYMGVAINHHDLEFDIWELELDYSGWFVKYHVNLQSMKKEFPELNWDQGLRASPFEILRLIRAEKEEDSALVLFVDHKVISHSLLFGTSKELCDLQSEPQPPGSPYIDLLDFERGDAFEYIETLVRV